jgi:hypothetical protein
VRRGRGEPGIGQERDDVGRERRLLEASNRADRELTECWNAQPVDNRLDAGRSLPTGIFGPDDIGGRSTSFWTVATRQALNRLVIRTCA